MLHIFVCRDTGDNLGSPKIVHPVLVPFWADHRFIRNDVLQEEEKAVFSRGEKIIPDVIGVFGLVLGFFIAESQEVKDSFNNVIDRVRRKPEGF